MLDNKHAVEVYNSLKTRKQIGNTIKRLRKKKEVPIEEVANALNVSVSTLYCYETGRRLPRDSIKVKLANYYGVPLSTIFYVVKEEENEDD